jgi:hypothetical protein
VIFTVSSWLLSRVTVLKAAATWLPDADVARATLKVSIPSLKIVGLPDRPTPLKLMAIASAAPAEGTAEVAVILLVVELAVMFRLA